MDALQLTRLERREHRVAVILRPDDDLPQALADRVQITQVLLNLLSNAIHAVSVAGCESPKILVSTYVNDAGLLEISVADNGEGIAGECLPRIFDRFFTTKSVGWAWDCPSAVRSLNHTVGPVVRFGARRIDGLPLYVTCASAARCGVSGDDRCPSTDNCRLSAADGKTATGRLVGGPPADLPSNRLRVFAGGTGRRVRYVNFKEHRGRLTLQPHNRPRCEARARIPQCASGYLSPRIVARDTNPQNGIGSEYREASVDKVPFTPHSEETCLLGRRAVRLRDGAGHSQYCMSFGYAERVPKNG